LATTPGAGARAERAHPLGRRAGREDFLHGPSTIRLFRERGAARRFPFDDERSHPRANGQLARNTTRVLLRDTGARLTLYLRRANRLPNPDPTRVTVVEGDVLDGARLQAAMKGQHVVCANLAGDMKRQAESIVAAMHATGLRRLIFISSMGIYGEVPGERYGSVLDPYRDSAAVIEGSDLDYTILRPGWFTQDDEVSYELTHKSEPFKGHDVSLNSVSDLLVKAALTPGMEGRQSIGASRGDHHTSRRQ
jgi:uncharacterized protein YbjT (DUF2867 family)